jgi:hypothetical protein
MTSAEAAGKVTRTLQGGCQLQLDGGGGQAGHGQRLTSVRS